MEKPTSRQQQVLDYVSEFVEDHGYPPTLREIAQCLGVKGTVSAIHHLGALERKGYLTREPGSSRSINLITKGPELHVSAGVDPRVDRHNPPTRTGTSVSLPIVGTVRAGTPEQAVEDILGHYSIDPSWVKGDDCYFLRVKGNSMIDAGIHDGDLAMIQPQQFAENGQVVVAMVDGEATMKRFFREVDHIRLQPENPAVEPIVVRGGDIVIVGRVLKTIHCLD